jgi:DNA replication initiation complex subunit (GINS family)
MYDELYAAWRVETESPELGSLTSDFYMRVADYLRRIKEENRMLDKKSVKATLLEHELMNARRMVLELMRMRYKKLVKKTVDGQKIPQESLTAEEAKLSSGILPSTDAFSKFTKSVLLGQMVKVEVEEIIHKRVALRFTKQVPSIIGADMKTYGPFMVEDVASVPVENAKILVKQHLAEFVEVT